MNGQVKFVSSNEICASSPLKLFEKLTLYFPSSIPSVMFPTELKISEVPCVIFITTELSWVSPDSALIFISCSFFAIEG